MAEQKIDCLELMEGMRHGVLALAAGGQVVLCNKAAGKMLGVEPAQVEDKPFAEAFAAQLKQGEELFRTLAEALVKGKTIKDLVVPLSGGDGGQIFLSLSVSQLPEGGGLVAVLVDVTQSQQGREQEKNLQSHIAASVQRLQQDKQRLQGAMKQGRRWRVLALLVVIILFAAAGYYAWDRTQINRFLTSEFASDQPLVSQSLRTITVQQRPLSSSISLSGAIEPLETINVLSPFTGKILKKNFVYGQKVAKGHVLVELDTEDLGLKLREAEVALIKAQENYRKLKNWSQSDAVIQARRALIKAQNDLDETQQKLNETQMLYKKGIVPLDQYRSLQEQLTNQKLSLKNLRDQLVAAKDKGSRQNVEVASLQLDNARLKLAKLKRQVKQGRVSAPVVGVAIKPSTQQSKQAKPVEEGLSATEGQVLLALGNLEGLSVTTQVGELNVTKLKPGQKVLITSYAFPGLLLQGKINSVSSQATPSTDGGQPSFEVRVATEKLSPDQRDKVRLGMTANLEVQVFSAPRALVVPIEAVHPLGGGRYGVTLLEAGGQTRQVPVQTGLTTVTSVEITKGLKPGDKVVVPGGPGQAP